MIEAVEVEALDIEAGFAKGIARDPSSKRCAMESAEGKVVAAPSPKRR